MWTNTAGIGGNHEHHPNRAEQRYNMARDILDWARWLGKECPYTEEQLRAMPIPRLAQLHREYYWARYDQMNTI